MNTNALNNILLKLQKEIYAFSKQLSKEEINKPKKIIPLYCDECGKKINNGV